MARTLLLSFVYIDRLGRYGNGGATFRYLYYTQLFQTQEAHATSQQQGPFVKQGTQGYGWVSGSTYHLQGRQKSRDGNSIYHYLCFCFVACRVFVLNQISINRVRKRERRGEGVAREQVTTQASRAKQVGHHRERTELEFPFSYFYYPINLPYLLGLVRGGRSWWTVPGVYRVAG